MSIGSFVLTGIGGGSSVALFINEGFGVTAAAPAPSVVLGGRAKRRQGRYEFEINGQRFVARSVAALEAMVLAWRKAQPANDAKAHPFRTLPAPQQEKEVVPHTRTRLPGQHIATPPATALAPGAVRAPQLVPISSDITTATQAFAAARAEAQAAAAQAEADEEADIEALLMMLLEAA